MFPNSGVKWNAASGIKEFEIVAGNMFHGGIARIGIYIYIFASVIPFVFRLFGNILCGLNAQLHLSGHGKGVGRENGIVGIEIIIAVVAEEVAYAGLFLAYLCCAELIAAVQQAFRPFPFAADKGIGCGGIAKI